MSAKLVVIEGADAAGKRTQTALLEGRLKKDGRRVTTVSFPQYSENKIGGLLRECIDGRRGDFFSLDPLVCATVFAADKVETMRRIRPALAQSEVVIFDRYSTANVVHQGAKETDVHKRRTIMQWVYELEHESLGIPKPDVVIALDVPAAVRMSLIQKRSLETGKPIDTTDAHLAHQLAVDEALVVMPALYPNSHIIECMAAGELREAADIAQQIHLIVHDILKA